MENHNKIFYSQISYEFIRQDRYAKNIKLKIYIYIKKRKDRYTNTGLRTSTY